MLSVYVNPMTYGYSFFLQMSVILIGQVICYVGTSLLTAIGSGPQHQQSCGQPSLCSLQLGPEWASTRLILQYSENVIFCSVNELG